MTYIGGEEDTGGWFLQHVNFQLLGKAKGNPAADDGIVDNSSKSQRAQLVQEVTDHFWQRWASEVTPVWVIRQWWHESKQNLKVGDLVLVHDSSKLKKSILWLW